MSRKLVLVVLWILACTVLLASAGGVILLLMMWGGFISSIGAKGPAHTVAFSPDGQLLAAGYGYGATSDYTVRVWDMSKPESSPRTLSGHRDAVESVAFSSDGQWLASGSDDETALLWQVHDLNAAPVELRVAIGRVESVAFSPDGRTLAAANGRLVWFWNPNHPEAEPTVIALSDGNADSIAYSPDGHTLAAGTWDGIALWDLRIPEATPTIIAQGPKEYKKPMVDVAFSSNGQFLAAVDSYNEEIEIRDWQRIDATPIIFRDHTIAVESVDFSPDGKMLASGGQDDTVRLYDVSENGSVRSRKVLQGGRLVYCVAFSPDNKRLAASNYAGEVRVWNLNRLDVAPIILRP